MAKTPYRRARKTGTPRRPATKSIEAPAAAKPAPPRRSKPLYNATFLAFLQANPGFYVGSFARRGNLVPKDLTLARLVRHSMKQLTSGKWAATTIKQGNVAVVLVAFVDKIDFDRVKAHHNGKPWTSPFSGASDAFSV
jgi:hypothetical protein